MSTYQAFLARLKDPKSYVLGPKLRKLLSKPDLLSIFDFFLKRTHQNLEVLPPGFAYRIDKKQTGLSRTLHILRSKKKEEYGEYKLIVETKSKLRNGTKQKLPKIESGPKAGGKPAWRVDGKKEEYFNLTVYVRTVQDLQALQREVELSQKFSSSLLTSYELGQYYPSKQKGLHKVSLYSIKSDNDLFHFLNRVYSEKGPGLSEKQKNNMISDLLNGLKLFHDENIVHQDLKLGNILVDEPLEGVYKLKLADYGLANYHQAKTIEVQATAGYHSPETAHYYSLPSRCNHEYFFPKEGKTFLTALYEANKHKFSDSDPDFYGLPDKKNDMWALGRIIYEIKHGFSPKFPDFERDIAGDPLLEGLFKLDRESRFDIDTAIAVHAQCQQESIKNKRMSCRA